MCTKALLETILAVVIKDDELAKKIATKCNDKAHDNRWCPTCERRGDGIEAYREMLLRIINEEDQ